MSVLLSLVAFIGVIVLASQRKGWRGLYVGGAILALIVGFVFISLSAPAVPAGATEAELAGAAFLSTYGPPIGLFSLAVAWVGLALARRGPERAR